MQQAGGHVAKDSNRIGHVHGALPAQAIVERPLLDILHDVIRRIGIPADIEQLHDVTIG